MTDMTLNFPKRALIRGIALFLLLLLLGFGAIPHYLSGHGLGSTVPKVEGLKKLQAISQNGLPIPGWDTKKQQLVKVGGKKWSQQVITQTTIDPSVKPLEAIVWLRGQNGPNDRPQVEWTDLQGEYHWRENPVQTLGLKTQFVTEARWLRTWWKTKNEQIFTFAALQWYAWPDGGHWSSNMWFWQDWLARLAGQREPWIAISLLVPMEPLGELDSAQPQMMALAEAVQVALDEFWRSESGSSDKI
ncbi:MAG: cyanoexosortase B system-associated protein [Prochlorotrichaceae cyanobacterium]|jgi:cyanoexosortase B-associated protein